MTTHCVMGLLTALLIWNSAAAQRRMDHVVESTSLPQVTITVNGDLEYIGHVVFPVQNVAEAEQFVFGVAGNGELTTAVIIHFEHFLAGTARQFQYPRLRMTQLGDCEYVHQTWAFAELGLLREPALAELLRQRGLHAGSQWVMDRYVRALPENPQYEVIIFYLEAEGIGDPSIEYGGMPVAPPPPPSPAPAVEAAVHERARAAFGVWPTGQRLPRQPGSAAQAAHAGSC